MAYTTLGKVIIKLSCQLLEAEADRDRKDRDLGLLNDRIRLSSAARTSTMNNNVQKDTYLSELQRLLSQAKTEILELDGKLHKISYLVLTAKTGKSIEGLDTDLADTISEVLQGNSNHKKEYERDRFVHQPKARELSGTTINSTAYWDDDESSDS